MRRLFLAAILGVISAYPATAQERSEAILVLDASGSMWGQIEGAAKIAIAQEVIGGLLQTLPDSQMLGLMAYGHRRKGDCTDIELLLAPTPDRGEIAARVNDLKPRGKTPMTDAVIAAAEALRYTEDKATVILVSDGIETCNPDPCAAARILEETGVDFTAHVIGFDVSDEVALAQMKCMAEETGGTFRTASDADELAEALQEVAAPQPEPEPVLVDITFRATEGDGGPEITEGLIWSLSHETGGVIFEDAADPVLVQTLPQGSGRVEVMRLADEARAEMEFSTGSVAKTVTLVLPPLLPAASLDFDSPAPAGGKLRVTWQGPGGKDFIAIAEPGMKVGQQVTYAYTARSEGDMLEIDLPTVPGTYEVRYVQAGQPRRILARETLVVEPVEASLDFASPASAGGKLRVAWQGPGGKDFIAIAEPGMKVGQQVTYAYTARSEGDMLEIDLPTVPGTYEVRYIQTGQPRRILVAAELIVEPLTASLSGPETVAAGAAFEVEWSGPGYPADRVVITRPGSDEVLGFASPGSGNPVTLHAPLQAGDYELRYLYAPLKEVAATRPIRVE